MVKGHKPDCQCAVCKRMRARAKEAPASPPKKTPAKPAPSPQEHEKLLKDYEECLEREKGLLVKLQLAQDQVDKADIIRGESTRIVEQAQRERNSVTAMLGELVDLLRSTSVSFHRSEGHRVNYSHCTDRICSRSLSAWFFMGEGPGSKLAMEEPDGWWDSKKGGTLDEKDEKEAPQAEDDTLEMEGPEPEEDPAPEMEVTYTRSIGPEDAEELPEHSAFAGGRARVLDTSREDPEEYGMPTKASV